MSFYDVLSQYDFESVTREIMHKRAADVEKALQARRPDLDDFMALISPAAEPYLEQMAQKSRMLTLQRFGKTIQVYVPLYLSNECTNGCVYCGFNHGNPLERMTLSMEQIEQEGRFLRAKGHGHILLVSGEHPKQCGFDYINQAVELMSRIFPNVSIEVAPMEVDEYKAMSANGLHSVYVYQETYNEARYRGYHPYGKKSNFGYRLATPERIAASGVHKVGLGCLLGLEDWRAESFFTALHLNYLEKHFWQTRYSLSFPRIRPFQGQFQPNSIVSDRNLLQLITAYRIFDQELELALSTRESAKFRDNMMQLGVTSMSAESKTAPGGYATESKTLEQFTVHDDRSTNEIGKMIAQGGYEPVWKDWDTYLQKTC